MKKIFLLVAFALTVSVASAWHKNCNAGVVALAVKHLTPEAKRVVDKHLGAAYEDDCGYIYVLERKKKSNFTKEVHYLHLDKDFQPLNVEGDDALVAIEKALDVLRTRKSHSDAEVKLALRYVINLMCDIHNFSNIRIENIPHSQTDFSFKRQKSEYKPTEYLTYKWSTFWLRHSNSLGVFHADLWAEDMELCHGKHKADLSKGDLRNWVAANGAMAAELLAEINPEKIMTLRRFLELDYLNYDMMATAGFRLAALLNDTIK